MPLGLLAKDSMINLAEMAFHKESEDHKVVDDDDDAESDTPEHTVLLTVSTSHTSAVSHTNDSTTTLRVSDDAAAAVVPATSNDQQMHETKVNEDDDYTENGELEYHHLPLPPPQYEESLVGVDKQTASYGNYAGFAADYSAYEQHYGDYSSYHNPVILGQKSSNVLLDGEGFWCCLFPWIAATQDKSDVSSNATPNNGDYLDDDDDKLLVANASHTTKKKRSVGTREDDEQSMGSEGLGERLSMKERQAVMARLRLIQADATAAPGSPGTTTAPTTTTITTTTQDATSSSLSTPMVTITNSEIVMSNEDNDSQGLLNNTVSTSNTSMVGKRPKSILKRTTTSLSRNNLNTINESLLSSTGSKDGTSKRRSLFPSYETSKKPQRNYHPEFSPMARVLSVKSHKDMGAEEKSCVWWQRKDYEEFRKTGRMITKAMLEGGSEIWLATNQSWLLPNKDRQSTLKHAFSLAEREVAFQKGDVNAKHEYEDARDKWWHKFGHSRRGLEHIASIDEGRQRQANVRIAIHAVVEEQRRQKVFHREDPEKLRMISLQHTSWARDLAMAAGASDADAVRMNFDDESRKSREFYLLKFSRTDQMTVNRTQQASVPAFMKPALTVKVEPSLLDTYTIPQIRFRQAQSNKKPLPTTTSTSNTVSTKGLSTTNSGATTSSASTISTGANISSKSTIAPPIRPPSPERSDSPDTSPESIPIKGESESRSRSSMAKQAAGFASGEEIGNMSAVLTGMGPISVAGGG